MNIPTLDGETQPRLLISLAGPTPLEDDQPSPMLLFHANPDCPPRPDATSATPATLRTLADRLAALNGAPLAPYETVRSECSAALDAYRWMTSNEGRDISDALLAGTSPSSCNVWRGASRAAALIHRYADEQEATQ